MEQQKLPNATVAMVLSIISFVGCCCTSGFGGLVLSGIALFLVKKDEKTYAESPETYSNFGQVKTAKLLAIIGLVLATLTVAYFIYIKSTGQYDDMMENFMQQMQEMQQNQ